MNSNQSQVETIFEKARAIDDAQERRAYVDNACAGNEAVRSDVESLLTAYKGSDKFLKTPVVMSSPQLPVQSPGDLIFGDYKLLQEIARGGMGVVYKALQVSLNRVVAIKMILAGRLASDTEVKRFRAEAQAAASLNHRNIVGIYEVGEHRGQHYYTMPFVEGRTLAQLVGSGQWRPGDGTEAARLIAKVARAVQCAHDAGILHRDLKPGNILIDTSDEPCITDFGLATRMNRETRLTMTGDMLGTPGFMAPEQARGKTDHPSATTDVYSLGAVLYFLLTGRPPFVADSALDALLLVLEREPVPPRRINPKVPGHLEHICLRCLQKRPQDRYASAGDLAADLEKFLKGDPLAVNSQSIGRRFEAWLKRQPALAARFCTVALCLAIVETAYHATHYTTPDRHYAVVAVLLSWLVISYLCQRGLQSERHANWVRFAWSSADPTVLTVILFMAQGFGSPLVTLYPTLIAASGFWFRVRLVFTTAASSLVGYVCGASYFGAGTMPAHWHILVVVAIVVTGLSVAFLVFRSTNLSRFFERHPPAEL